MILTDATKYTALPCNRIESRLETGPDLRTLSAGYSIRPYRQLGVAQKWSEIEKAPSGKAIYHCAGNLLGFFVTAPQRR